MDLYREDAHGAVCHLSLIGDDFTPNTLFPFFVAPFSSWPMDANVA